MPEVAHEHQYQGRILLQKFPEAVLGTVRSVVLEKRDFVSRGDAFAHGKFPPHRPPGMEK